MMLTPQNGLAYRMLYHHHLDLIIEGHGDADATACDRFQQRGRKAGGRRADRTVLYSQVDGVEVDEAEETPSIPSDPPRVPDAEWLVLPRALRHCPEPRFPEDHSRCGYRTKQGVRLLITAF
jgi:hypothetical protein